MPKKQFLEAGQIVGTHGIGGEVRIHPWCDSPQTLAALKVLYRDAGKSAVRVKARVHKHMVLARLDGVDTIQDAAALRDTVLWLNRDDLPLEEGCHFVQDMIGLSVVDAADGHLYGELTDVSSTGANDIYHVRTPDGEVLVPAVPSVVKAVDLDGGVIKIEPIKGLFDDAD